jgi:thiol-disulfide isomerase/thioredoxin
MLNFSHKQVNIMIKNSIYILFISIFLAILSQAPVWAQVKPRILDKVIPPNPPALLDFEGQFIPGDNRELIFVTSYGCHACQTAKKVIAEVNAKAPANVKVADLPLVNNFLPPQIKAWAGLSLTLTKMGLEEKLRDEIYELTLPAEKIGFRGKVPLGTLNEHFSKRSGL